jgi:hypothetical protein
MYLVLNLIFESMSRYKAIKIKVKEICSHILLVLFIILILPFILLSRIWRFLEKYDYFKWGFKIIWKFIIIMFFIFISSSICLFFIKIPILGVLLGVDNSLTYTDNVQLSLYIFQLLIISFWIFIWYLNFKELMRKNIWDHYPKIKLVSLKTKNKKDIPITEVALIFENIGENIVEIRIWDISFRWQSNLDNHKKQIKIYNNIRPCKENFFHEDRDMRFDTEFWNNVLYKSDKKEMILKLYNLEGYRTIQNLEIEIFLNSYWVVKKGIIITKNEFQSLNFKLDKFIIV